MFAVIRSGGKQYHVGSGDRIRVEKIDGNPGDSVDIADVLFAGKQGDVKLGETLSGASVKAEIVRQFRDDKVLIFKKKRRHNYRRTKGHRQYLTEIKITDITF